MLGQHQNRKRKWPMSVNLKIEPELDPDFVPAVLWNRAFEQDAKNSADTVTLGLLRDDQAVARRCVNVTDDIDRSVVYIERMLKTLLWTVGGNRILFDGPDRIFQRLETHYAESAVGRFDSETVGAKIYGQTLRLEKTDASRIPEPQPESTALGRHLDGCRIGFDLGGSDRKCAALIGGEVVFSEEIPWDPYFEKNPQYHMDGIMDSLERAAAHLPRVDAVGGSAAGVYVNSEVRIASLFRGVPPEQFDEKVRPIFKQIQQIRGGTPFEVVNDGEVTALAGSMSLNDNAVLGISMGTSLAAGYVTPEGNITSQLNELAFVPVDYRANGPVDEWSGDAGCGVQYFSQQGVARLAASAGIEFPPDTPFAEQLVEVQRLMADGDARARKIYETVGICFGYAVAQYAGFYDFRHLLILGRVTSGGGGQVIIRKAGEVLRAEFPELAQKIRITTPDEQMKRHGQAVAAASLPRIGKTQ
jgi:predicted NBD/HSP70 family sugar kinase